VPTQDIVLGIYYMTRERLGAKGEGKIFASPDEVRMAYDSGGGSARRHHSRILCA
jgi:DNA-directed RNA polymerase subunit beta'